MQIASYTTETGDTKFVNYNDGRFTVDDHDFQLSELMAWDQQGMLTWTSPEMRQWAQNLTSPPPTAPSQSVASTPTKGKKKSGKVRRIQETRYTCQSCGRVWHYGKQEQLENAGNAMQNCGKSMMCCSGCAPAAVIPNQKVVDPNRCPDCGSRAVKSEVVTHEVP